MGVLPAKKSLVQCEQLATSSFCRRRLSVVMVRNKMAETVREACTFIEQVCVQGRSKVKLGVGLRTKPAKGQYVGGQLVAIPR